MCHGCKVLFARAKSGRNYLIPLFFCCCGGRGDCLFPLRRRTFQCMNYLGICLWHQHHLSFGFVTVLSCKMLIIYPNRSCKQLLYPQHVLNSNQSLKFQPSLYKFISFTFFHFNFEIACVSFLCDLIGNVKDIPIYNKNWTSKRDRQIEKEISKETEKER